MNKNNNHGFTLTEILIAIAIVGILFAVAVPSYSSYITNSRRIDAQVALRNAAQELERCRTQAFTYANCDDDAPTKSQDGYYDLTYTVAAATFTITAKAVTGKSQAKDTGCTEMTITQTGATGPTTADCW